MSSPAGGLQAAITHCDDVPSGPPPGAALSAFVSPGRAMWGTGSAAVIEVPAPWVDNLGRVREALTAIEVLGPPEGPDPSPVAPVALGALPFDRSSPAQFIVPATLWIRTADGDRARIDVTTPGATEQQRSPRTPPSHSASGTPTDHPRELRIRSVVEPRRWAEAVSAARDRIRAGELTKVVLAREIAVHSDAPIDEGALWTRLVEAHPQALCFAVDGFLGASPELLVSRAGSTVRARPMAGTTARTGHPEVDQRRATELVASEKNRAEHQVTIDMVHDSLLGWCSYLDAEPTPSVVAAGPVQHLATLVEGRLSRPEPSVLELVAALHPTPAVGGEPTGTALEVQAELEPSSRGRYAGPVGWVDVAGNGMFAVGIRSVEITGTEARLFAGVGVVADSDPEAELAETRAKAQAMLSAIVRI